MSHPLPLGKPATPISAASVTGKARTWERAG